MNVPPPATASTSSQAPAKKQRRDEDKPPSGDKGAANLISLTRRRVWRACESCRQVTATYLRQSARRHSSLSRSFRRKKIKCDGTEPVCGQCTQTNSNCTWIQTKDRAALSRQYVQELENRVIRLETVLTQVAPSVNLDNLPTGPITLPPQQPQQQQHVPPPQAFQSAGIPGQYPGTANYVNGTNGIPGGPSIPPRANLPSNDPSPRSRIDRRDDVSDEFVAEQMGTLALDDHGHLRWIGGSSTMSLIEAFRNFSASEDRDAPSPPSTNGATPTPNPPSANLLYFPSSLRFGKVRALPGPEEVEYPPYDLADKLVDAYFDRFHHTMPVLDSISFRKKYQRLMDARRQAESKGETPVFGSSKSDAGFVSVVFAVYAVAARFVDDERLKTEEDSEVEDNGGMAMVYYERAMILYYIGATATQLAHVQSFVLLSSFLASLNCLPQAWLLCGQAVRIAQDLGLHRSPRHLLMSPLNKETRRKVWWCVYGLDRMLAGALGRPLGTEDSDCDVELPLPIDDVDLPTHFKTMFEMGGSPSLRDLPEASIELSNKSLMAGFNALTELYVIVGKVLRTVYAVDAVETCKEAVEKTQAQVAALDKELTDWCERLPATFKSDPKSPQQISLGAILCSSYYSALITLHRNFLPTKRKGSPNPNWASVPKAVFASRSCILLSLTTKEAIPRSHHLAFFTQALFSAAVIILLCARFATVESAARTASEEVNTALVCLDGLQGAWPGAKMCRELLQELVEATRQAMRVQVPGVGRPGNVNGLVDPTPPGVDKVQTVYNSFKRAVNEGEQAVEAPPEEPEAGPDEKQPRKIKAKPRSKSKPRRMSESPSPPSTNESANASVGEMDMDYLVHDPHEPQSPFNRAGRSLSNYTLSQQQSPQSLMKLTESSPVSTYNHGTPSVFSSSGGVPHDWLPSPTMDSFGNMTQFNNDIFANVPPSLPSLSQPQSPIAPHRFTGKGGIGNLSPPPSSAAAPTFDFSSTNLPFGGFDFLQGFSTTGAESANGTTVDGFDAGNAAAWTDFVQTGVFNNVPDQPFNLTEHDHEAIIGMSNDGDD